MKKLIAILAAAIGVVGFSAVGQDWTVLYTSGNYLVWDEYSRGAGVGEAAGAGDVNVEMLWAPSGTSDLLGSGTGTNGVSSSAAGEAEIAAMLSGGWTLAQNSSSGSGTAPLGTVETATAGTTGGKGGSITAYNGGSPFEISTSATGASGSTIEVVLIGFNGTASSWNTASDLGWSSMVNEPIGLTSSDPNANIQETGTPGLTAFGVAPVPEPATLALAGLGGLATLMLRRRKA